MQKIKPFRILLLVMICWLPSVHAADQTCNNDVSPMLSLLLGSSVNSPTASFSSGGIYLKTNTQKNENDTVTTVTDGNGQVIVTSTVTTTGVSLQWFGEEGVVILDFPEPLAELPSYEDANRLAAYIAWQVTYGKANQGRDAPGCDLDGDILESTCGLLCCADHDKCYKDNGCTFLSWATSILAPEFNTLCNTCNGNVVFCLLNIPPGHVCLVDNCYDAACGTFFECENPNSCDCTSPCDAMLGAWSMIYSAGNVGTFSGTVTFSSNGTGTICIDRCVDLTWSINERSVTVQWGTPLSGIVSDDYRQLTLISGSGVTLFLTR